MNNKNKCDKMLFNAKKNLHKFDYHKNLNKYLKVLKIN